MATLLHRIIESPVGPLLAGVVEPGEGPQEPGGVCLLEIGENDRRTRELHELESHFGVSFLADTVAGGSALLDELAEQLGAYFEGGLTEFTLPLCAPGTAFQHRVWNAMREIPFGETETYGALARRIGMDASASRAVGAASGRNRVSIIIPCHRVVAGAYDPELGGMRGLQGYGGGIENKQRLLEHERAVRGNGSLFAGRA